MMMNEIYYMNSAPGYTHWEIVLLTWTHWLFLVVPGLGVGGYIWWNDRVEAARKPIAPVIPMPARLHRRRAA